MPRDVVFDPDPPNARYVHTRFYRNHVSRGKQCFLPLVYAWNLMDLQSQSMPRTVHEKPIQPVCCQYRSGCGVYFSASPASPYVIDCSGLRFQDRVIPGLDLRGRLTHKDSSRDVAAISVQYSTQVQHHQLPFLQAFSGGPGMWQRRPFPKSDNGFKGRSGSAALPHLVFDLAGNLEFADSRL